MAWPSMSSCPQTCPLHPSVVRPACRPRPGHPPRAPAPGTGQRLTAGLHADQLQLNAPDGGLRALHHQLSCQRMCDDTVGGAEVSSDEEFGEHASLKKKSQKQMHQDGKAPGEITRQSLRYKQKLKTKLDNFYKIYWDPALQNGGKGTVVLNIFCHLSQHRAQTLSTLSPQNDSCPSESS